MNSILCVERADDSWVLSRNGAPAAFGSFRSDLPRAPGWFADVISSLDAAYKDISSVDGFLCGIGPGSFSGIRSVLAAFQGLALPRGLPVLGLSSAAALAREVAITRADIEPGVRTVSVVGDARRGLLWCASYDISDDWHIALHATGAPPSHTSSDFALVPPSELPSAIPSGAMVVSSEASRLAPFLATVTDAIVERDDVVPSAGNLIDLYLSAPEQAVRDPSPIYLHPAVVGG